MARLPSLGWPWLALVGSGWLGMVAEEDAVHPSAIFWLAVGREQDGAGLGGSMSGDNLAARHAEPCDWGQGPLTEHIFDGDGDMGTQGPYLLVLAPSIRTLSTMCGASVMISWCEVR